VGVKVRLPEVGINMLLCRHAAEVEGRLFLSDAGLTTAPPDARSEWYIAGAIDLPVGQLRRGGSLRVVDAEGEPVDPTLDVEIHVEEAAAESDANEENMARVNTKFRLPDVSGLSGGLYAWKLEMGNARALVPFFVAKERRADEAEESEVI
jgi:hypothetical protein